MSKGNKDHLDYLEEEKTPTSQTQETTILDEIDDVLPPNAATHSFLRDNNYEDQARKELGFLTKKEIGRVAPTNKAADKIVKKYKTNYTASLKIPSKIISDETLPLLPLDPNSEKIPVKKPLTQEKLFEILKQYIPTPPEKSSLEELDLSEAPLIIVNDELMGFIAENFPKLRSLNLNNKRFVTAQGLANLGKLTELRSLYLRGCDIKSKDLSALVPLSKLEVLDLGYCDLRDGSGLKSLNGLPLRYLNLHSTKTNDAGLQNLTPLAGTLQTLILDRCTEITNDGLQNLSSFAALSHLSFQYCNIGNAGLEHLAPLTGLKILDLALCDNITDIGVVHLSGMTELEKLSLNSCYRISDNSIKSLQKLTALRDLDLGGCIFIGNNGLTNLKPLTLVNINLKQTRINDEGLRALDQSLLETIDLGRCPFVTIDCVKIFSDKVKTFGREIDTLLIGFERRTQSNLEEKKAEHKATPQANLASVANAGSGAGSSSTSTNAVAATTVSTQPPSEGPSSPNASRVSETNQLVI